MLVPPSGVDIHAIPFAELIDSYQASEDARALGQRDPTDPVELSHRWMLRNDLRGYVLLGDPAARLSRKPPEKPPCG